MEVKTERRKIHAKCVSCNAEENGGYCDEHKLAIAQIESFRGLPSAVSKMTGILGLIGTLIILLVGLLFNAHVESIKEREVHSEKFSALSSQISKLENETDRAVSGLKTEVLKLSITLDQMEKARNEKSK